MLIGVFLNTYRYDDVIHYVVNEQALITKYCKLSLKFKIHRRQKRAKYSMSENNCT